LQDFFLPGRFSLVQEDEGAVHSGAFSISGRTSEDDGRTHRTTASRAEIESWLDG